MRIVDIVRPHMTTQDSNFRPATPVEKKVEAALGRLATGECYRSNIRYGRKPIHNYFAIQFLHQ